LGSRLLHAGHSLERTLTQDPFVELKKRQREMWASFDVVLSQFGHMFAPRPDVVVAEMRRVLKPGGRIAFATWPSEHFVGRLFAFVGRNSPPPRPAWPRRRSGAIRRPSPNAWPRSSKG
jgi:SAM-dependent methyltransferase